MLLTSSSETNKQQIDLAGKTFIYVCNISFSMSSYKENVKKILFLLVSGTASSCKQMTNPAVTRDLRWATQSNVLSFNTAGIWPEGADGTDINDCCKSNNERLIATCDDFGKVNLFAYPSCQLKVGILYIFFFF